MKNNNLNGLGPGKGAKSMRYRKILQGEDGEPIDLVVKASDTYEPASTKKNGRYKLWGGSVNLRSGTETHFKFQFVNFVIMLFVCCNLSRKFCSICVV